MSAPGAATIHATALKLGATGVLIRGPSGSGKSSLALSLLDAGGDTARLIADDRVELIEVDGAVLAAVPPPLAGKIELRGQGPITVPHVSPARLHLVVDLLPVEECPRYAPPNEEWTRLGGCRLPWLRLPVGLHDGPMRVRFAVAGLPND